MASSFLLADTDPLGGETIRSIVELCSQFGPVAFAVLFLLVIIRWSHGKYADAVKSKLPAREVATLRGVFVGTAITAVALVAVSVWWWLGYRPQIYLYQGELINLHDYERISSTDLYRLEKLHGRVDQNVPMQRNEQFVVIRTSPFREGETFAIDFSKGDGRVAQLDVPFMRGDGLRFALEWDEQAKKTVLKRVRADAPRTGWINALIPAVHAKELDQGRTSSARAKATVPVAAPDRATTAAIDTLQNPRSSVGAKLNALDVLERGDLGGLLKADTQTEPLAVTLADLSRHSDKELAARSQSLLGRGRVDDLAVQWLKSSDSRDRARGEMLLSRMEAPNAGRVVAALPSTPYAAALANDVRTGKRATILRPTASAQGDRYYVQAAWQSNQPKVTDCLSALFNAELINDRSLAQEQALMRGQTSRTVYWYDKQWAIGIAAKIERCGAKAAFVIPGVAAAKR